MKRTVTDGCGSCPFAHDTIEGPVHCIAYDGDREIPSRSVHVSGARPPRWCPLRSADYLVTLRRKD